MKNVLLYLFLVALAAIVYWQCFYELPEPLKPRQQIKAKSQVLMLELMASSIADKTNLNFMVSGPRQGGNYEIGNESLCKLAVSLKEGYANQPDTAWLTQGHFDDPWGHDYIFLLEEKTKMSNTVSYILKVRSLGPNGIDDGGSGDDITSSGSEISVSK